MTIAFDQGFGTRAALPRRDVLLGLLAAQWRLLAGACAIAFLPARASATTADTAEKQNCKSAETGSLQTARRHEIEGALQSGFGVQYWGQSFNAADLKGARHGLLIIEIARIGGDAPSKTHETLFTPEEIREIRHGGSRPVLGYVNVAKIEPYRDYWVDAVATAGTEKLTAQDEPWIGPTLASDGTLARYWTPEWQAILQDRVDRLMALGVDGIFFDDVLQYFAYYDADRKGLAGFEMPGSPHSASGFAVAMMKLVSGLAAHARQQDCSALIVVNNGVFIGRDAGQPDVFDQYRDQIDGILIESVFAHGGNMGAILALQEDFASAGVPVLTIEFLNGGIAAPPEEAKRDVIKWAASEGFATYVADDSQFNRLFAPVPMVRD